VIFTPFIGLDIHQANEKCTADLSLKTSREEDIERPRHRRKVNIKTGITYTTWCEGVE
jgi:hypothetical protein